MQFCQGFFQNYHDLKDYNKNDINKKRSTVKVKLNKSWSYNFNQLEFFDEDEDEVYLKDKDRILKEKLFKFLESEDFYIT